MLFTIFSKHPILNLWEGSEYVLILNISRSWILQHCQYVSVLIFQGYTWLTYFLKYDKVLNMSRDSIMEGFWIFQNFKYARFRYMQALHKALKLFRLWQRYEHPWSKFYRALNGPPILSMLRLRIYSQFVIMGWLLRIVNMPEEA